MERYQNEEALIQNLRDAGCSEEFIEIFEACRQEGREQECQRLLKKHRQALLEALHKEQKYIDCLDYLVYQLKK